LPAKLFHVVALRPANKRNLKAFTHFTVKSKSALISLGKSCSRLLPIAFDESKEGTKQPEEEAEQIGMSLV